MIVDLSGHLSRQDHRGTIISDSQQHANEQRSRRASEKIAALLEAKRAAGNTSKGNDTAPPDAMVPEAISTRSGEPTQSWWAQLVTGSTDRPIEKTAAIAGVRGVMARLAGEARAKDLPIDFDAEIVTVGDVHHALETLTNGPTGYRALLNLAGRG